ncbi:TetR family transcriptional regulator [Polymorphobacter sp. PAMC 29334]|uniref:TetR/AcrR family transcriptional regulator n=1 Tax=Polymorphobacter sp. PAMC 29334 TaxID=2862331 RepID=UPI001C76F814|nr:TetR family transcriptional regulator [Polymorphobacter sp. PAMC 29334]QYE34072.1 TetR family transcriptional regulator [Polymorphobacter sp. PAMC 29334]
MSATAIIDAARLQVRRFGEAKTNVVDIARALGTSHTTIYRHFRSKADVFDALVITVMRDEEELAAAHLDAEGSATERLMAMILDLYRRKLERFAGDREIHDLYRRIVVERPDIIAGYAERMTALIGKLIAQGIERGEWKVDDVATAAGVVRDAVTTYVNPAFVALLVNAGAPVEDMVRATINTLARAFEAGMVYAPAFAANAVAERA